MGVTSSMEGSPRAPPLTATRTRTGAPEQLLREEPAGTGGARSCWCRVLGMLARPPFLRLRIRGLAWNRAQARIGMCVCVCVLYLRRSFRLGHPEWVKEGHAAIITQDSGCCGE